ncbi:MAG: class I SAM-dependent DNA methyltransferase [Gammaproteobacteria bacterium]|nr:class I SAM-dependent DNA methyltransferase [Gammaproteobacteria bacterium]
MPLSWNEIRSRAHEFSKRWIDEESERAEAQSFWNDFFAVFGIERKRVAIFEKQVAMTRAGEKLKHGRIDAFWKGMLLIEHKSRGADLNRAFAQATDYFDGIAERDLPRYILVSDFERFRLYDLEDGSETEFKLADLHKRIKHFAFVAGYRTQVIAPQNPVNIKAAERMGKLHDRLKASGYEDHPLEVLLVRLLFCLFAEDTGIFQPAGSFRIWLDERTAQDGSDLGAQLTQYFQTLNTPEDKRSKNLDEQTAAFPYVNGKLFEETLPIAAFDAAMRDALLDCCALDWAAISPAIFGALFQSIMDDKARRNLGAHYTSEENILKLIKPLFLDALWAEFDKVKRQRNKLFEFHKKLRGLTFFDPACGCGNFLVIAYRELRLLELDILRASLALEREFKQSLVDIFQLLSIDVDQFHGIEIEEFPAQIAQVALWLVDHQMNLRVSEEFGMYFARIPLKTSPKIVHGNALTLDWNSVLPAERASYVMGNPPFIGHQWRNAEQMADMERIWGTDGRFGRLDYVTCWHRKAADYMKTNPAITCALVSTNSICQGEQVGTLWGYLLEHGARIHFAHRTFSWSNEARGKAAVHCVIVGFGLRDTAEKTIFEYEDIKGEPHAIHAANINPYLVDAPDVILPSRTTTPPGLPQLIKGSQPTDGGYLILTEAEKAELLSIEPAAEKWLRVYIGGEELINGNPRWCLWLKGIGPGELKSMPHVIKRVAAVAETRKRSPTKSVREFANQPTLFTQDRQPDGDYLALPEVSSENRRFIPIGFLSSDVIASNQLRIAVGATLFHFGIMNSTMHNAWVRYTCGRLESRYRYEPSVYNNFPWPLCSSCSARGTDAPADKTRQAIEAAAQAVLDARAAFPGATLADLYDPLTMPPALLKAHQKLDAAVDKAYGKTGLKSDAERVAFLFQRYQALTSLLPAATVKRSRKKPTAT